ncbi:S8 family serine peptidase [Guptibacillus algicola]|uniref:S8 family serine peptidase n=1 Tax=Guptibacillus algicola TaxID=225844 RepID=UPI001CD20D5C|nr:S8 family serine peptidase [Alkalihalobacillus algicola]MCA0987012.1 S8 family serine peptidase [Alkalihalobacillus algicola]
MKKFMPNLFKTMLLFFLLVGGISIGVNQTVQAKQIDSNQAILILSANTKEASDLKKELSSLDSEAQIEEIEEINLVKIKASSSERKKIIERHFVDKFQFNTENIGEEQKVQLLDATPNAFSSSKAIDSEISFLRDSQWDVNQVTQDGKSYELQAGNHGVTIGMIDSGIDFNHPDLSKNIVSSGKSFVPGIQDTQDVLGHGTMVAGSIAANGTQKGVGPGLGLIPYKVFHNGSADSSWIIDAIIEAANDGVDVINLSLGTYKSPKNKEDRIVIKAYEKAVKYAKKRGVFVVASAGSSGYDITKPFDQNEEHQDLIHLPGGMKGVFTVAATTKEATLASYSNFGRNVDMGAPGGDYGINFKENQVFDIDSMILTTYPVNAPQSPFATYFGIPKGYDYSAGSSLASPKVAATAGLIIAEYRELHEKKPNVQTIERILVKGANHSNEKEQKALFRHGILDVSHSLELLQYDCVHKEVCFSSPKNDLQFR